MMLISLSFAVDRPLNDVDAQETKSGYWDWLLSNEINEVKQYVKNINTNLLENNLTAIKLESEGILDSTGLRNISTELQNRGDQDLVNQFKNTIANIAVSAEDDRYLLNENIRNLSRGYNSIINVLGVADIDYEKLFTSVGLVVTIFVIVLLVIPRIKKHCRLEGD
jgi:hypothetical protein